MGMNLQTEPFSLFPAQVVHKPVGTDTLANRDKGIPKGRASPLELLGPRALPSPGLFLLQNKARVDT